MYATKNEVIREFKSSVFPYKDGFRTEPKFEESIAGRTKLRKQKSDEQPDTTDMTESESEEIAAQRRNQPGQELKILTLSQMFRRLPISLA